ncbi:hypothetical protein E2562_035519 [Oryza meyeriana var. granulata]|uniref:Uncharacterized protein n=1 Tax=Oryza meyeriana var. granulata TaxID=110450 RepID=A0A6G1D9E8_9ORYZ|nr:hypothetical protein E2562_035519 [Oryza meyeriana var. granulata]
MAPLRAQRTLMDETIAGEILIRLLTPEEPQQASAGVASSPTAWGELANSSILVSLQTIHMAIIHSIIVHTRG